MIENIKRLLSLDPKDITISRIMKALLRRIVDIPHRIAWYLPWGFAEENRKKLIELKNIHLGKRCFIIANGPSLKHIDFSLLKNEITIGMNRVYLMKDVNGFEPNYLACIDKKSQLLQFTNEYDNLKTINFYNWDLRHIFKNKNKHIFLKERLNPKFSKDLLKEPFGSGKSVTYVCMQLAYFMGFNEVYLIGKDHSYDINAKAGAGIKSTGAEDNHFIKGYYKPGMNWDAPDYKSEEYAYKIAKKEYEKVGGVIKDATINGCLDIFEKIDFYSLFSKT